MVFESSVAPDITEALPAELGGGLLSAYPPNAGWDVSFDQLGFLLRPSQQYPYQRGTEAIRKQQLDVSETSGEQSLSSWWVRSQDSWDMGAGVRWYEPGSDPETVNRYANSLGVDVWTPGQATLLKRMEMVEQGLATPHVCSMSINGVPGYVYAAGTSVRYSPSVGVTHFTTLPGGGATQPSSGPGVAYIGHDGGVSIYTPGVGRTTPLTCVGVARAWWVKSRLIVSVGPTLYEVLPNATGAITTVGTVLHAHPSLDWVWTDVAETGGAILASGYAQGDSGIHRFSVTEDALNQPVLQYAGQIARMPVGERIYCMGVYLATQLVLGTSLGVRVGLANETGEVQYGPLTVETLQPVVDVAFRARFAYVTVTGEHGKDNWSGVYRVDLSTRVGESDRAPYAPDAYVETSTPVTSLALMGERVVLATAETIYVQSGTKYVQQGWLDTGRIRYHTSEPKAFRLARAVVDTNGGRVALTSVTAASAENRIVEYDDTYRTEGDVLIQLPGGITTAQYLSFRVYLTASAEGQQSPILSGLSIKAQPAASRVRLYQFPLSVYDLETTRHGLHRGMEGGAYRRLLALEAAEEASHPLKIIDHRTGEAFTGMIDSIDVSMFNPPDRGAANFGGVAVVTVRRI